MGTRAYVCQVCDKYIPVKNNRRFSEVYEEGKKTAEKKIRELELLKLEEFEIAEITSDDEIDLSIDEFEEMDEEEPLKFEKRKAGKANLEDSEDIADTTECPFCGDFFENLRAHIQECEFAPEDVSIEDILPSKPKKKKKKPASGKIGEGKTVKKQACPYCGKEFQRLGRHLNSCPKKPKDAEDEKKDE